MTETVTITPQAGVDANDDPLPAAAAFSVAGYVAPGNTTVRFGVDGDLDQVQFTVYLPLKIKLRGAWARTTTALTDNFTITVRDQVCVGRAQEWDQCGRGGVVILASANTGAQP